MRVPAPITVSSIAPRSTVVLAPISTSSSITTRPSCGTDMEAVRRDREPETLLADAGAGVDVDPIADQRMRQRSMRADPDIAADLNAVADHRHGTHRARAGRSIDAVPDDRQRPDFGGRVDPRRGGDDRGRMDPGGDRRRRMEQRRDPCPGDQRIGGDDRHGRFAAPCPACPDGQ